MLGFLLQLFRTRSIETEVVEAFGSTFQSMGFKAVKVIDQANWASLTMADGQVGVRVHRERGQYWVEVAKNVQGPWWYLHQLVVALGAEKHRWSDDPDYQDPRRLPYLVALFAKHKDLVLSSIKTMPESDICERMARLGFNSAP